MRLIIDDDPKRIAAFRRAFGASFQSAATFTQAAALLTLWDGHPCTVYLDCDGVEGERIAERIAEMGIHRQSKFYIHSSNYGGSVKMRDTLASAGYDVEMVSFSELVG
jgi:hypothetical protein